MDDGSLKLSFFRDIVSKGIQDIYSAQVNIARQRLYQHEAARVPEQGSGRTVQSRSGMLMDALEHPHYSVGQSGDGLSTESNVPLQIRFLDMKKFGNFKIYNRQVWGILYQSTLPKLKYEYRDWVQSHVGDMLDNSEM